MTDNRFPTPGTDARFPTPGTDVRFPGDGLDYEQLADGTDTRFSGDTYGGGAAPDPYAAYVANGFEPEVIADFSTETYRDNASNTTFDTMFTYTGASLKTMFDSDGVLKWAPHNTVLQSEDMTNVAWANTGASIASTTPPSGFDTAFRFTCTAGAGQHRTVPTLSSTTLFLDLPVTAACVLKDVDVQYVCLAVNTARTGATSCAVATFDLSNGTITQEHGNYLVDARITALGGGWYFCEVDYDDAGAGMTGVGTKIYGSDTGTPTILDFANYEWTASGEQFDVAAFHLYRSDLPMVNNPNRGDSYVPTTSAKVEMPRRNSYVYGGTSWVNRGIFLESEARTNIATRSQDFSVAPWANSGTSETAAAVGPDGVANSAFELNDTSGTGVKTIFAICGSPGAGVVHTASAFLKQNDFAYGGVSIVINTSRYAVLIDLTDGSLADTDTVGTPGNTGYTVEDCGNGWYRVSVTASYATGGTGYIQLFGSNTATPTWSSNVPTRAGVAGSGILIYGAQFEAGSTPSSYIPTSGATATRAAETLTIAAAKTANNTTAMSFAWDGLVTYTDNNSEFTTSFATIYKGSNDSVYTTLDTTGALTGLPKIRQRDGVDVGNASFTSCGLTANYTPGVNVPMKIASRHTGSASNIAVDGTSGAEEDLEVIFSEVAAYGLGLLGGQGHVSTFRQWAADIGDTGIEEASSV